MDMSKVSYIYPKPTSIPVGQPESEFCLHIGCFGIMFLRLLLDHNSDIFQQPRSDVHRGNWIVSYLNTDLENVERKVRRRTGKPIQVLSLTRCYFIQSSLKEG